MSDISNHCSPYYSTSPFCCILLYDLSHIFLFLSFLLSFSVVCWSHSPLPSSLQAAKLQWSLDEKVEGSRGTRVSRPFEHLHLWCLCVLVSGFCFSLTNLVKHLCSLLCFVFILCLQLLTEISTKELARHPLVDS